MADRSNPLTTYLTDAEYSQIKEFSEEADKSMSHLLREAILEYTDRDRTARLEEKTEEIDEKLDQVLALVENDTHTHTVQTGMSKSGTALEKARKIIRKLQDQSDNPDGIVKNEDVEIAIEDLAGVDDRTLAKYKSIFRKRGYLFEHPGQPPLWTLETDQWLTWMEDFAQLNGVDEAERVADEYPARVYAGTDGGITIELAEIEE